MDITVIVVVIGFAFVVGTMAKSIHYMLKERNRHSRRRP